MTPGSTLRGAAAPDCAAQGQSQALCQRLSHPLISGVKDPTPTIVEGGLLSSCRGLVRSAGSSGSSLMEGTGRGKLLTS